MYIIYHHIYIYIYSLWWSSSPSALFPTFSLLRHHQPLGTLPGDAMRLGLGLGWLGDNQPETICFAIDRLQWNHIYIYIRIYIYMYNIYIYILIVCFLIVYIVTLLHFDFHLLGFSHIFSHFKNWTSWTSWFSSLRNELESLRHSETAFQDLPRG